MTSRNITLNAEQLRVVEADVDARLLVLAGAGQGKTEVVANRIEALVRQADLSASEEILVLSFSRAAVSAVKSRLNLRDVAVPNVRTFDSFANLLLQDAGIEPKGGFDDRIRRATQVLEGGGDTPDTVDPLKHIFIDEVQDLVGDRADFVLALLRRLGDDAGITALGDPLQGVYDFQLEGSKSKTKSKDLFEAFKTEFGCGLVNFQRNYRARGIGPKRVVMLGKELDQHWEDKDGAGAKSCLEEVVEELPQHGVIGRWFDEVAQDGRTTAILCATNADALRVSRFLRWKEVAHTIRRLAQDFGAARWVAQALGPLPGPKERRSEVEGALGKLLDETEAAAGWRELKLLEGRSTEFDALDLIRVHKRIRAGAIPLALTEPDNSSVVVSTIHRAKGLEFDRVFLVKPTWLPDEESWTRVCRDYVALSRARDEITVCEYGRPKASITEFRGRFQRRKWSPRTKRHWTESVEFQYNDIEVGVPACTGVVSALEVQAMLAIDGLAGSPLHLQLDEVVSTPEVPSYLILTEDGRLVGRTSDHFNTDFVRAFGCRKGYPVIVDGLTLASVETVAGDARYSEDVGLGTSGFWLVPRATGLVRPDWKDVVKVEK